MKFLLVAAVMFVLLTNGWRRRRSFKYCGDKKKCVESGTKDKTKYKGYPFEKTYNFMFCGTNVCIRTNEKGIEAEKYRRRNRRKSYTVYPFNCKAPFKVKGLDESKDKSKLKACSSLWADTNWEDVGFCQEKGGQMIRVCRQKR